MAHSVDIRMRAIVLYGIYGMDETSVATLLDCSPRSVRSWNAIFNKTGFIEPKERKPRSPAWDEDVQMFVRQYSEEHPCFFLEELQEAIQENFPHVRNISIPTICRALRHDLGLSRKHLQKRAREARPDEIEAFRKRLFPFYMYPEQLVFVDETSKDSRSAVRSFAWSAIGTPAVVNLPFSRGKRVSALAVIDSQGFVDWSITEGTFTRKAFYEAFLNHVLPHLQPWPMPNSIVLIDNTRIHMFREVAEAVYSRGAYLFYLPPYCPHMNPIEFGFASLKRWIQRYANLAFPHHPKEVLDVAFPSCTNGCISINTYEHCGYEPNALNLEKFLKGIKKW